MKFSELNLDKRLLQAVENIGFEEATPIQSETIPLALEGKDVIGQAQTGTGKTAAFGLPMLDKIDTEKSAIQGLVIAPTRELAIQTQEEIYRLGKDKRIKVQAVYGGADIGRQIKSLKNNPHIVVGTPGRMLDHINRRTLKLDKVETLVLDEADEMLNMGFLEDIEAIISKVPETRQTLLFSATMPDSIKRIGVKFMKDPEHVKIKAKEMTANLIDQYFVQCKEFEKFDVMTRLFDVQDPALTIVFGRTKRRVDELARGLEMRGYKAEGIHGDLPQHKRMSILKAFKNDEIDILVATDVAARGLDISGVSHVYNYDIPQDPESYVHRIGRTGRAGKEGMSVTLVTPNEMSYLHVIENLTKRKMTTLRPPSKKEAIEGQIGSAVEKIQELIVENGLQSYQESASQLLENHSAEDLVSLLIKQIAKDDASEVPVNITPERPLPGRRGGGGKNNSRGGNRGGNSRGGNRGGNSRDRDRDGGNRGGNGGNRDRDNSRKKEQYNKKKRPDDSKPGENRKRGNGDGNRDNNAGNKDKSRGFVIRNNQK